MSNTTQEYSRDLVTVRTVDRVEPIENADRIETVVVDGWRVVNTKNQFSSGDQVVFFEIDSQLPLEDHRFKFLGERGIKQLPDETLVHRLKTVRLRGVYSQGLILPVEQFTSEELSDDIATNLGVTKYEPITPTNSNITGNFPAGVMKTDSERTQNLVKVWDQLLEHEWVATEKVDGTSLTVTRNWDHELTIASRNWAIEEGDNIYWVAARRFGLDNIEPGMIVQAEIFGEGIQKNPLKMVGQHVRIFTVAMLDDDSDIPRGLWTQLLAPLVAPVYEGLTLADTAEETVERVNKIKSLVNPNVYAEGVVWHHPTGERLPVLGHRSMFKTISNHYILKND